MAESRPPRSPSRGQGGLEILALSSLAIAQPLFDVLGSESTFFVAHGSRTVDLVAFALGVWLGPALLLAVGVAVVTRLSARLGGLAQYAVLGLLTALILLPPLARFVRPASAVLLAAAVGGAGFAAAMARFGALRSFVHLLAPLTLVVPILFLFASPVAKLLGTAEVVDLEVDVARPAPIVIVLLDELPVVSLMDAERGVDAELFPAFARLAATSHWFRNATAVTHNTNYAVPALLTGNYPQRVRAPIATDYPRSLFTLLGSSYDFHVEETQTDLCPDRLCGGGTAEPPFGRRMSRLFADAKVVYLHIVLPEELTGSLPAVTGTWTDFATGAPADTGAASADLAHIFTVDRADVFERFIDGLEARERPTLHFIHVMLPHVPWAYAPSGKEYWASITSSAFAEGVAADTTWTDQKWLVDQGHQRHLLQVAFVDRLIGRLLDRLEVSGLDKRALLVVTADHGLSFVPGEPGREPNQANYADIMAVPLFVRTPGQAEGRVSDRNVELTDVLPTIADVLGIELPMEVDGVSAFDEGPERSHKVLRVGPTEGLTLANGELEAKYRSLESKLETFAGGLFAIGPHRELLDRRVAEVEHGPAAGVEIRLEQPDHYRAVDVNGPFVPSQVFGRARWSKPPDRLDLAIAVNGVIRAITRTFAGQGGERFAAMVPELSFVAGENEIEVLVADSIDGRSIVRPAVENAAPTYRIGVGADGEVERLVASDGSECRLDPEAVEGGFIRSGTARVGWARDPSGERRYVVIMAFADGRLVHTTTTGSAPPASSPVANDEGFAEAGFRFNLPVSLVESTAELRLFAVLGERGSELVDRTPSQ